MRSLNILKKIYTQKVQNNELFLPRIMHVETRSKCNGTCSFCPASVRANTRDDILMPFEFIEKIIHELSKAEYKNRLSFYNNNEPFLDNRIYKIIKLARHKLPWTYLELKTNGLILSADHITKIFDAGLDMLYINDYSTTGNHHNNIDDIKKKLENTRRFKGHFENGTYFEKVIIALRKIDSTQGTTRAGNNPQYSDKFISSRKLCVRPLEMMTINPKGDVSVCSEDVFCSINMGNIGQNDLMKIWTSEAWNEFRIKLLNGERSSHPTCSKCSYMGYNQEILKENILFKKKRFTNSLSNIKKIIFDGLVKSQKMSFRD